MTKTAKYHTFIDEYQHLWVIDVDQPTLVTEGYGLEDDMEILDFLLERGPVKHVWSTTKEGEYV